MAATKTNANMHSIDEGNNTNPHLKKPEEGKVRSWSCGCGRQQCNSNQLQAKEKDREHAEEI